MNIALKPDSMLMARFLCVVFRIIPSGLIDNATKIFHRNGDPTTNEWASKVIAKETAYKQSMSSSGSIQSATGFNSQFSVSEVEEDSCPPKEFIGLKNGGKKNNYIVEGILFQSGRLWNKDRRWSVRQFRQTQG